MAKDETRRLSPQVLSDDFASLAALGGIPGYAPGNDNYSFGKLTELKMSLEHEQDTETRQEANLKAARDAATAKEWEFHNAILRAKEFVIGQFGKDSNEIQAVGLKRKSEYKSPQRNGKAASAPASV